MRRSIEKTELPTSSVSRKAEVEMGGAHSSENRWTQEFKVAGMATPHSGWIGSPTLRLTRWKEQCWEYVYVIKSEMRGSVEESELPTYRSASCKAEVEMGGAHSTENW
ncbi:jg25822 [Pararge aegeria aegeria]|uniref:Jg25822 protein n=1 Tax=Pararge aegeria aegeria TaxID=348720 RepID=A0A8S4QP15_9NEOP|nr:jg25822 [Pararge aegeria aegeria]